MTDILAFSRLDWADVTAPNSHASCCHSPDIRPSNARLPLGPISPTLFRAPRLAAQTVEISRVRTQLEQNGAIVRLLLGPPGCGKSTALIQHHAREQDMARSILWISLTEEDNDPDFLIHKLSLAVTAHLPGPPLTVPSVGMPAGLPIAPENTALFIDGLEMLHDEGARRIAEDFILSTPDSGRCYATAFALRSGALHEARLRGMVECIEQDAFHFTDQEAAVLLGSDWSLAQASRLNQLIEGWVAGLRFLAQDPKAAQRLLDQNMLAAIPVHMAQYFDDVVCAQLSPESLAALMDASVLERFTAEIFANIPGQRHGWQVIEAQLRAGLFLSYTDDARRWVTFHPMFGRHLRERVRCADPARFDTLQRFAAVWFQDHGFAMEAVRHAGRLSDPGLAVRIIEDAGGLLTQLGRGPFMEAEQSIDFDQASALPMTFLGNVYLLVRTGHVLPARQAIEQLRDRTANFTVFQGAVDAAAVRGFAHIIEIAIDMTEDQPVNAERIATLERLLADYLHQQPVIAASMTSLLSISYVDLARFDEAATICDIGFDAVRHLGATKVAIFLRIQQACVALARENVGKATLWIEDGLRLAQQEGDFGLYETVATQIVRAELHYEANELEAAQALIDTVMPHIGHVGSWVVLNAAGYSTAAAIAGIHHGIDCANAHIQAGEQMARQRNLPRLTRFMAIARMRELIRAREWRAASEWLEEPVMADLLGRPPENLPEVRLQVQALLETARFMVEMGRPVDAITHLDRVNKAYLDDSDVRQRFTFRLLAMRAAFAQRRYNAAVEHMQAALDFAMRAGLVRRAINNRLALIEVFDWSMRNGRRVPIAVSAYVNEVLRSAGEHDGGEELQRRRPRRAQDAITPNFALSPRETEIIALIAEGYLTKEIAARLQISDGTVKSHRKKIHEKLGVISKSQAIVRARELLII